MALLRVVGRSLTPVVSTVPPSPRSIRSGPNRCVCGTAIAFHAKLCRACLKNRCRKCGGSVSRRAILRICAACFRGERRMAKTIDRDDWDGDPSGGRTWPCIDCGLRQAYCVGVCRECMRKPAATR